MDKLNWANSASSILNSRLLGVEVQGGRRRGNTGIVGGYAGENIN